MTFTSDDALDRITEIGQAFENDLNDGENDIETESCWVDGSYWPPRLGYGARLEDGTQVVFEWELREVTPQ